MYIPTARPAVQHPLCHLVVASDCRICQSISVCHADASALALPSCDQNRNDGCKENGAKHATEHRGKQAALHSTLVSHSVRLH